MGCGAEVVWGLPGAAGPSMTPNGVKMLAPLDKKIIPKPKQYTGAIKDYASWNSGMKDFLQTQDERWKPLLEELEKLGAEVMTEETQRKLEEKSELNMNCQLSASCPSFTRTSRPLAQVRRGPCFWQTEKRSLWRRGGR